MPWQQYVADVGCEILDDGSPAYSEIIFTVPRQSGKTTLSFTWQLDRCLSWGRPQRSAFTAQTGKDARDKWLDELFPALEHSPLAAAVSDLNRGNGNEAVKFHTGSLIRVLATSAGAGHSKTLDQAVLDEVWHDIDDRREQGLRPAMITRSDRQLLICSTAGTDASIVYNHKVTTGRRAVKEDSGIGIAYFEWSAPDDWDPADKATWWTFMPALGHTITPEAIEVERQAMKPEEFRRAYGNRSTRSVDRLIPLESWLGVVDEDAKPDGPVKFALDITEDRGAGSIVACDAQGVLELVEHRAGLEWIVPRANELAERYDARVWVDEGGPASSLLADLSKPHRVKQRDVLRACGAMFDAIEQQTVTFRADPLFDEAVAGVVKREVGDLWGWSRKASVTDITPLMAATLAFLAASRRSPYEDHGLRVL
ncbi:MAG: phage terminase large subunit family protein [Actinomycetota bacterium]